MEQLTPIGSIHANEPALDQKLEITSNKLLNKLIYLPCFSKHLASSKQILEPPRSAHCCAGSKRWPCVLPAQHFVDKKMPATKPWRAERMERDVHDCCQAVTECNLVRPYTAPNQFIAIRKEAAGRFAYQSLRARRNLAERA